MTDVLAIILGGGQGKRLYPLTYRRSKPAVPIGGKYRLIDIPISNCLHAGIRRIFVLTQFNSASLNRHVGQTYRLDHFSPGLRRHHRRRADARDHQLVPGHGRCGPARHAALHQPARRPLPDPRRRPSVPDGLRRDGPGARRVGRRHHDRRPADERRRRPRHGHLPLRSQGPDRGLRGEALGGAPRGDGRQPAGRGEHRLHDARRQAVRGVDGDLRLHPQGAGRSARRGQRRRLRPRDHPEGARPPEGARLRVQRLLGRRRHAALVLRRQHQPDPAGRRVQLLPPDAAGLLAAALPAAVLGRWRLAVPHRRLRRRLGVPRRGRGLDRRPAHAGRRRARR